MYFKDIIDLPLVKKLQDLFAVNLSCFEILKFISLDKGKEKMFICFLDCYNIHNNAQCVREHKILAARRKLEQAEK